MFLAGLFSHTDAAVLQWMGQGGETVPLPLPRGGATGWTFRGIGQNSTAASFRFSSGSLELESELHREQERLRQLRRASYQLSERADMHHDDDGGAEAEAAAGTANDTDV